VAVAIEHGNLYGVQFHPEKSQDDGLRVLAAFFEGLRQ
jgi:imidazoleglycerol phosphate synthase glutamine amidotransferase subunit HisH